MQELSLGELQQVSINILKDVHSFCLEKKIKYSIAYGTLIGAVRHKGFIPWDDDVDIVMPRPDFEKFCHEYSSNQHKLIYYGNDKSALAAFARVCECTKTHYLTERPWTKQESGVWIDIFPLDGISNSPSEYEKKYRYLKKISKIVYKFRRQNHHISSKDSFWSIFKTFIAKIIGVNGIIPHYLLMYIVHIMKEHKFEEASYFGQMSCLDDGPIIFNKKDFTDTVLIKFEDTQLCAMNGFDNVLKKIYGDYMQLPPIEKRNPKQYWIKFLWK